MQIILKIQKKKIPIKAIHFFFVFVFLLLRTTKSFTIPTKYI